MLSVTSFVACLDCVNSGAWSPSFPGRRDSWALSWQLFLGAGIVTPKQVSLWEYCCYYFIYCLKERKLGPDLFSWKVTENSLGFTTN